MLQTSMRNCETWLWRAVFCYHLLEHRHGRQRNCTLAMCRDRFRLLLESSWWLTDRERPSEKQATLSATQTQTAAEICSSNQHIISVKIHQLKLNLPYLVRLVNNDGIIGKCFHNVEVFNGGWGRESSESVGSRHWNQRSQTSVGVMFSSLSLRTYFPNHSWPLCPKSSGRPRVPLRLWRREWLWEDPGRCRSPPLPSCKPIYAA